MKKIIELFSVPKSNKIFISVLTIIAIISGALFYFKLNLDDQNLIKTYFSNLVINNEYNSLVGLLGINFLLLLIIWLLGISIIGLIINLFIYFAKVFLMSLEITTLINLYKGKGILIALLNVFPHQIFNLLIFSILVIYAINVSLTLIVSILKKETISFGSIMKSYNKIFAISLVLLIITVIYEYYLAPIILKLVLG